MDQYITALSDVQRRRILVELLDRDLQTDGGTLPPETVVEKTHEEAELYHNHLPWLADADFVRWNRNTNEVVEGPRFEEIEPLIELLDDNATQLPGNWV